MNTQETEIVKISINSYITSKITFSNFISEICESVKNVDGSKVLKAIGKDHRIKFLSGLELSILGHVFLEIIKL